MELKVTEQSPEDFFADKVYAAMETGNTGRARCMMIELRETHPELYATLRAGVIKEYGVSL